MKKLLIGSILLGFTIISSLSCSKSQDVNCSNAQVCVINHHGKVVHYSWDMQGVYTDSIMPNASACKNVGQVIVNSTTTETPTTYFYSDDVNLAITVSQCNQTQVIQ